MRIRFYLAASINSRDLMRQYKRELEDLGHIVTSRWIEDFPTEPNFGSEEAEHKGRKDFEDISLAWCLLLFTEVPSSTGGYNVELGYALAKGRTVIVIGPYTNIFQKQCNMRFETWEQFKGLYLNAPSKQSPQVQATSGKAEDV